MLPPVLPQGVTINKQNYSHYVIKQTGKMNLNCAAVNGQVLCVSQFTLLGDARGQNRPGFTRAEQPERANELYLKTCELIRGKD